MAGRDPHERHRVATPLELLFDLTFVIAFGVAASGFSHALAEGHVGVGFTGFIFATFATCWAWINFTWFASAYDTDDWVYRLLTMVQMVGVLILALGIPPFYASIEHGGHLDNELIVAGYVVMRVAMVAQWLRAARQDPARKPASLTYATVITVVQVGWIASIFLPLSVTFGLIAFALLACAEMIGPWLAESRRGGTPWHAHHIAERYGLLAIIALGEGVVGTVASLTAVVGEHGWTPDAAILAIAGTGLTFGMWWIYFSVPTADLLHRHRERSFWFGYLHIAVFGAIVATGAGLHTAAYYVEEQSTLGSTGTVLSVAVPVGVYVGLVYLLYLRMVRTWDVLHVVLLVLTIGTLAAAVVAASAGVPMTACLLIVTLAPVVSVVGFEIIGHRHMSAALDRDA
ncbi:low temperature requirement protein A [Mycobacterium hodleri]|uniref:Low temperature requirement protein A n=1 Tax=Mycolicibacterium hodleri TaxID=49897 RepID=A0A544W856_9MYCO|nr:low temperature requirement protein A [Mycolicibacterium hodleri]TQR88421.1 low temperature requirement protein A [Mycolicibacterium hodleri]